MKTILYVIAVCLLCAALGVWFNPVAAFVVFIFALILKS